MSRLERRVTVAVVVVPFLGFVAALVLLWGGAVTWVPLALFLGGYGATGFGITIGFHRLLTHRSFDAPPAVRAALAILGSMAVQGSVIRWVADHRKHHTFADEEGDPHSPHVPPRAGWRGVLSGFWHAHTGWLFDGSERASARRFAPDLRADAAIRFVDRWFPVWALLGLAIPGAIGFAAAGGTAAGLGEGVLWGGLVRIFLVHHATWSVNSICHIYGRRAFRTDDASRNNWAIGLLALGEGWHHNHHAFPTSARHGLVGHQLDPSYALIRLLEALGLASKVRVPTESQIAAKLIQPRAVRPPRVSVASERG